MAGGFGVQKARWLGSLAAALVASSALVSPPPVGAQIRSASQPDDGEALFRAIFFLDGAAAAEIPELRRMKSGDELRNVTARQRSAISRFQNGVLAEIRSSEAAFLREFGGCVRSGDRRAISRCLTDGIALIDRVVERTPSLAKSRESIRATWGGGSRAADANKTGVGRAVAVAWPPLTYNWPNVLVFASREGESGLLREELVNSIATRLKGSR